MAVLIRIAVLAPIVAAYAQQAPQPLVVTIAGSLSGDIVRPGSDISVDYSITNPSPVRRTISTLGTPLEKVMKFNAFHFSPNVQPAYLGMIVKRQFHVNSENTVALEANGVFTKTLSLKQVYAFYANGNATVFAEHPLVELIGTEGSFAETLVKTNTLQFSVVGAVGRPVIVPRKEPSPNVLEETCEKDTGGMCHFLPCHISRGPTECVKIGFMKKHCMCKAGYCAVNGECVEQQEQRPTCPRDTGGTCRFLPCHSWRGSTTCDRGGWRTGYKSTCMCKPGYCAVRGECHEAPDEQSSQLTTHDCSPEKRKIIVEALPFSKAMIRCVKRHQWVDPFGYFNNGQKDQMAPDEVSEVLDKAAVRFDDLSFSVQCNEGAEVCDDQGYTFACVYPSDPDHKIYLATQFWHAPPNSAGGSKVDTKAGTLIHEMTHFVDVGATQDMGYGNRILSVEKALQNADSYEYYCETCHPEADEIVAAKQATTHLGELSTFDDGSSAAPWFVVWGVVACVLSFGVSFGVLVGRRFTTWRRARCLGQEPLLSRG